MCGSVLFFFSSKTKNQRYHRKLFGTKHRRTAISDQSHHNASHKAGELQCPPLMMRCFIGYAVCYYVANGGYSLTTAPSHQETAFLFKYINIYMHLCVLQFSREDSFNGNIVRLLSCILLYWHNSFIYLIVVVAVVVVVILCHCPFPHIFYNLQNNIQPVCLQAIALTCTKTCCHSRLNEKRNRTMLQMWIIDKQIHCNCDDTNYAHIIINNKIKCVCVCVETKSIGLEYDEPDW